MCHPAFIWCFLFTGGAFMRIDPRPGTKEWAYYNLCATTTTTEQRRTPSRSRSPVTYTGSASSSQGTYTEDSPRSSATYCSNTAFKASDATSELGDVCNLPDDMRHGCPDNDGSSGTFISSSSNHDTFETLAPQLKNKNKNKNKNNNCGTTTGFRKQTQ